VVLSLAQPPLPLPPIDIPTNLEPPLGHGRVSVHGWLWLPVEDGSTQKNTGDKQAFPGWFYHHTPEFFWDSPHNFEIMVFGELLLDHSVSRLPFPPKYSLVGTEYVFTPPEFSLDELITLDLRNFYGKFTNGSFDTPQRYLLSMATFTVQKLVTAHYLFANATNGYPALPYLSYPRNLVDKNTNGPHHLYFLHLLEKSPDFDQIIHVTVDPKSCLWISGDSLSDLTAPGATFEIPNSENHVLHRLVPSQSTVSVDLVTEANREGKRTRCQAKVIEEIHCVVVPDSFANCPPVAN
jgi:hypothetical protein